MKFTMLLITGGYALEAILRYVFHRMGPLGAKLNEFIKYTFPDNQTFMATIVFGFIMFLIIRHISNKWIKSFVFTTAIVTCLLVGMSELFFSLAYPSDITAGYVFGGFWLCLNIILLETFRVLPIVEKKLNCT